MRILQVSALDKAGGAESIAWQLFENYRNLGYHSSLAVGLKVGIDPDVWSIGDSTPSNRWEWLCLFAARKIHPLIGKIWGVGFTEYVLKKLSRPKYWFNELRGHEQFDYPESRNLMDRAPYKPDIIHCHNLTNPYLPIGGYFDLRSLPWLSAQKPTVMTLHDAWLLSGHCAHSFACTRWQTGCGHCPDLTIYPAIRRDATAYNWKKKREIFSRSRLFIATPSQWLMDKVQQSMLAPAALEFRVIPNGVDLSIFHPADKKIVREELDLPETASILLFTANGIRKNVWKDFRILREAVALVADRLPEQEIIFIALGEAAPPEQIGQAEVRFIPYQANPKDVAQYFQAADIYVHAARADTFPNVVLEALACGTPVVATAVGGIPEQIKGLNDSKSKLSTTDPRFARLNRYDLEDASGLLVPPGNAQEMAKAVTKLLINPQMRKQIGANAARDAGDRFDVNDQVKSYLDWYQQIIECWNKA